MPARVRQSGAPGNRYRRCRVDRQSVDPPWAVKFCIIASCDVHPAERKSRASIVQRGRTRPNLAIGLRRQGGMAIVAKRNRVVAAGAERGDNETCEDRPGGERVARLRNMIGRFVGQCRILHERWLQRWLR